MEGYNSGFENPFSTPEIEKKGDDKEKGKESKKPAWFSPEKRQNEAKKIGETLEKSPIFKREKQSEVEPEADKKPELKHLKEPDPADEAEAPTEVLGEQEKAEVVQELAAARREEVASEAVPEDGDEITAEATQGIEAAEAFLDEVVKTGDVEAATDKVAAKFGLEISVDNESPQPEELPEEPIELADEAEIPLASPEPSTHEEDTAAKGRPQTAAAGSGNGGGAAGGRGNGPLPPFSGGPGGPMGGGPQAGGPSAGFNTLSNPALYTAADLAEVHRRGTNDGLLVGGILGYLIGRRRGRIKTEKRLLPVQKRLEKQVKGIQQQLYNREFEIRQLATEKAAASRREQVARGVAPPERTRTVRRETRLGLEKPVRAEKLGKVIVQAEATTNVAPELRKIVPEQVKNMSRQEVLQIGEKVTVEGTSLRQMYEGHLLGEQGLRRVVIEYLRGHDVRQALKQELVEREIDFERDPMLRDKAYREMQTTRGDGSSGLQQLLQKAGVDTSDSDQLSHVVRQLQMAQQESLQRESRQRKLVDTAMITLIVILAAIITAILLSK